MFIAFTVAIILFIPVVNFLMMLRRVTGNEFRLDEGVWVSANDVPQGLRDHFTAVASQLDRFDFEFSHYEKRKDIQVPVDAPRWVLVLKQKNGDTYAEIWNGYSPDVVVITQIAFVSFYENCDLVTANVSGGNVQLICDFLKVKTVLTDNIVELWEAHGKRKVELETEGVDLGKQQIPTSREYPYRLRGAQNRHFHFQAQQGILKGTPEKYRMTLFQASKLVPKAKALFKKEIEFKSEQLNALNAEHLPEISVLEIDAYHRQKRIEKHSKLSGWIKVLIFCASAVFFAVLFGAAISWSLLLSLIPVLLFHELGHLAAMKWFGYRDLHMFFVPLGAVAIGTKKDATPWQEAIVLLAGPVPGIVLALGAAWMFPDPAEWLYNLILMSFIINYFNLLPFPPLDGGQLMQLVLYNRFPAFKVIIKLLGIVLFGLVAYMLEDPLIFIFAVFLAYSSYSEFKVWQLVRTIKPDMSEGMQEDEKLAVIFRKFRQKKWLFFEKYTSANLVINSFTKSIANFKTSVFIMMCYVGMIVGPGVVMLVHSSFKNQQYYEASEAKRSRTVDEWIAMIQKENDPHLKVGVLLEAANYTWHDDSHHGEDFIKQAVVLSRDTADVELFAKVVNTQLLMGYDNDEAESYGITLYEELEQQVSPNDKILATALDRLVYIDDDEQAIKYLKKIVLISRQSGDTYLEASYLNNLAERYWKLDQYDLAEQSAISASEVEHEDDYEDEDYSQQYRLAEFYVLAKRYDTAVPIFESLSEQILDSYTQQQALVALGWLAMTNENIDRAEIYFNKSDFLYKREQQSDIEEMGLAVKLLVGEEAIASMNQESIVRKEQKLVVAYEKGLQTEFKDALSSITEMPYFVDIPTYLENINAFSETFGVWSIRSEYVTKALESQLRIPVAEVDSI